MTIFLYVLFAIIFVLSFWFSPDQYRKWIIIAGNFLFMFFIDDTILLTHLGITFTNFFLLRYLARNRNKVLLVFLVCLNLSLVVLQKFRTDFSDTGIAFLSLSFMTFINLSYILEVYKKETDQIERFSDYYAFSGFFPCLLMGPIERSKDLLPQLLSPKKFSREQFNEGAYLLFLGIFKKFVVSNRLTPISHPTNLDIGLYTGIEMWVFCLIAFVQIYCDFSGFIDITRGFSKILGIELGLNFDRPYLSTNVANTWQRWNISFVNFLRHHVYTPVLFKTKNLYVATVCVMLLTGLWHKMTWPLLLWALYWAVLYCIHIHLRMKGIRIFKSKYPSMILMVLVMAYSTVFLEAATVPMLVMMIKNSFTWQSTDLLRIHFANYNVAIAGVAFVIVIFLEWLQEKKTFVHSHYASILNSVLFISTIAFSAEQSYLFLYMGY